MELNDKDIAQIEGYLDGTLTTDEVQAFETRMQQEPEFAAEVDLFLDVIEGLKADGRNELKAHVGIIGASVMMDGNLEEYTPSLNPDNSSETQVLPQKGNFGRRLFSIIFMGAVVAGVYMWYTDQIPEEWLKFFKSNSKVKADTIQNESQHEYEEYIEVEVDSAASVLSDTIILEIDTVSDLGFIRIEERVDTVYHESDAIPNRPSAFNGGGSSNSNGQHSPFPAPEPVPDFEYAMAS